MDSQITQSALYNFLGWAEANKKRVLTVAIIAAIVGVIVFFFIWRSSQSEIEASEALSELRPVQVSPNVPGVIPSSEYSRFANEHANTAAGTRALLLTGSALFNEGKYGEAFDQFEKFLRQYPESPVRAEAMLGSAASQDAQQKITEATARYQETAERFPGTPAATQAKFALARLYEIQNKPDLALKIYEELGRNESFGSLSLRSQVRGVELMQKFPNLKPTATSPEKLP